MCHSLFPMVLYPYPLVPRNPRAVPLHVSQKNNWDTNDECSYSVSCAKERFLATLFCLISQTNCNGEVRWGKDNSTKPSMSGTFHGLHGYFELILFCYRFVKLYSLELCTKIVRYQYCMVLPVTTFCGRVINWKKLWTGRGSGVRFMIMSKQHITYNIICTYPKISV